MRWIKKGVIFKPDNNFPWMVSHASVPVVDRLGPGVLRIYFGTRDAQGRSHVGFIDVDAQEPKRILHLSPDPVLPLGKRGTFDDNGIMPSWIVDAADKKYLYYIGWNPQVTVSYRLSIGLAVSDDGGRTFVKHSEGPICDRDAEEPYFNTTPCVLHKDGRWRMWYTSGTKWEVIDGHPEPFYLIKNAVSPDGVRWQRTGRVCIGYDDFTDAIARPCVYQDGATYKMIYSFRSATGYRTDPSKSYRLGYAESVDGDKWIRKDTEVRIERSPTGWDSEMMEYCTLFSQGETKYLFYNGNGFGQSGLGYAVSSDSLACV